MKLSPPEEATIKIMPGKKKGSRSVASLSPQQLERKRANDREAQRAIRARTKSEIAGLKNMLDESQKREKALIEENMALRDKLSKLTGQACQPRQYPTTAITGYNVDGLPGAPGSAVSSQASSLGQGSADYSGTPGFGPNYLATPSPCESWSPVVSGSISSPCSSTGCPEDYVTGFIPTSVPSYGSVIAPQNMSCLDSTGGKAEYDDLETSSKPASTCGGETSNEMGFNADWMSPTSPTDARAGYRPTNIPQQQSTGAASYLAQQPGGATTYILQQAGGATSYLSQQSSWQPYSSSSYCIRPSPPPPSYSGSAMDI
ncbi:hypothetical protein B0H66DRAFT_604937 [Apodospora peruviana]|uniref:BZIP domain-containing protein n=1 Tax=Apodospora peruviana TaxID=516989 RepID=A0AAE0I147_9PEZI|nr:hypothetical protein B0H66DRAFT_604937 [Apodospora peruviana]